MNHSTVNKIDASLKEITQQLKHKKEWNLALSGGYDSNLLLHCIKKYEKKPIKLYSIGGKEIDETVIAKKIITNYTNCNLKCEKVDENSFEQFADIIWRLEGYLFQDGIFLQNTLAKLLQKNNMDNILLGEMADQLLNFLFYSKQIRRFEQSNPGYLLKMFYLFKISKKRSIKEVWGLIKLRKFLLSKKQNSKNSHDVMFDYILKKNGLLLNSYGIQSLYPFLKQEIHESINPRSIKNIQKRFFKKQVKDVLPLNIGKNLNKNGGTTDIYYLFKDHFKEMEKTILHCSIIRSVFNLKKLGELLDNPKEHWHFLVQLYFISIVEQLFTTSHFNLLMKKEEFKPSVTDIFNSFIA